MTKTVKAGRELDALIAEKVMGWRFRRPDEKYQQHVFIYIDRNGRLFRSHGSPSMDQEFHPSTDIAAAWQVVEKFRQGQYAEGAVACCVDLRIDDGVHLDDCEAHIYSPLVDVVVSASSMPLAICLAALKAVGVDTASLRSGKESHEPKR